MRKRDYQAEYAARKKRAIDRGFTGYSQQRVRNKQRKNVRDKIAERMAEYLPSFLEATSFEDIDEDEFWRAIQEFYRNNPST